MTRRGRLPTDHIRAICTAAAVALALTSAAGSAENEFELAPGVSNSGFVAEDEKAWEEQAAQLPLYPADRSAGRVTLPVPGTNYTYTLHLGSLSIGGDEVVRYSITITSPAGVENVMYEGLRCRNARFKTYAYGSAGEWSKAVYPAWRPITRGAGLGFRKVLYKDYFCDDLKQPYERDQIVAALQQSDPSRR